MIYGLFVPAQSKSRMRILYIYTYYIYIKMIQQSFFENQYFLSYAFWKVLSCVYDRKEIWLYFPKVLYPIISFSNIFIRKRFSSRIPFNTLNFQGITSPRLQLSLRAFRRRKIMRQDVTLSKISFTITAK